MHIYQPYTYLIGWTHINKYYYGVRYKNNCNPTDFWVNYFTSSKKVQETRKQYGEPDIVEIRKTFDNKEKAILWEQKVLKRLKVKTNIKWLNIAIGRPSSKGYKHTNEHKKYISSILKGRDCYWSKGKKRPEHSIKISNKMWVTNETIDLFIDKTSIIPEGFRKGRKPYSAEWKSKLGGDRKSTKSFSNDST